MTFHLAIPAKDLAESKAFYIGLGAKVGRESHNSVILNFFECQLVLHQSPAIDQNPEMYPRHFGVITTSVSQHQVLWNRFSDKPFVYAEMFTRGMDTPSEHRSFFLKDPSNNLIEFKWYKNPDSVFG